MKTSIFASRITISLVFTSICLIGCKDDRPSNAEDVVGAGGANASFALTTTLFDDVSAATYVAIVDSLEHGEVDLSSAREFPGWSSVGARESAVFVGHGEKPEVTRFDLNEDDELELADEPNTVNFGAYGLATGSLAFNTFVDGRRAHMSFEDTGRILWDTSTMTIVAALETPAVETERDGLTVTAANFQGRVVRGDSVFQPYFWHDADWYEFHQNSQIAVYTPTGELHTSIETPCPALQVATTDEEGNIYFTGMSDTIPFQLREDSTLERCAVRIDSGTHEIAEGWPRRFEELTEGRPTGAFHYLENGIGILTVYHVEDADPQSETFLDDWFSANWGLWLVNLEEWSAEPIQAWERGSSNVFFSRVDDRLFVHSVEPDFSFTTIYEFAVDGSFTPRMSVPGYAAYPLLQLR